MGGVPPGKVGEPGRPAIAGRRLPRDAGAVCVAAAASTVAVSAKPGVGLPTAVLAVLALVSVPLAHRLAGRGRSDGRWFAWPLCLGLLALVGVRAGQDLAGLAVPLPGRIDGLAQLGSDPERSGHGSTVELVAGGRRWFADFDRESESVLSGLRTGDRIEVVGRPSEMRDAPQGWVRSRHLAGRLVVESAVAQRGTPVWFAAANWVHELLERGSASMSAEHRSLYLGLVVGDDRAQDDLTRFHFRASGLTHLLAVSGQNIAFVLVALAPLLTRLTFRWRWGLAVVAIVAFVLVTRAEPSVLRAAVMAVLALTAISVGRVTSGLRVLALTVSVLMVADPMLVHSVGFRLSVAATAGLVVFARPLTRWLRGPEWIRAPLAVTVSAQIGAVPVMVATFGPVSVLSVPANLLAEPAAGLVMTTGLTVGLLAGVVREELAWLLQAPARLAVWWVDSVASGTAGLSVAPDGFLGWTAVLGGGALAVWLWRGRGRRAVGRAVVVAAAPMVLLLRPPMVVSGTHLDTGDPVIVQGCPCGWVATVGEPVDERVAAAATEALWQVGLARVAALVVPSVTPAARQLAASLRCGLVTTDRGSDSHPGDEGTRCPCGRDP